MCSAIFLQRYICHSYMQMTKALYYSRRKFKFYCQKLVYKCVKSQTRIVNNKYSFGKYMHDFAQISIISVRALLFCLYLHQQMLLQFFFFLVLTPRIFLLVSFSLTKYMYISLKYSKNIKSRFQIMSLFLVIHKTLFKNNKDSHE